MPTTDDDISTSLDTDLSDTVGDDPAGPPPVAPRDERTVKRSTFVVTAALAATFGVLAVVMSIVAASVDRERSQAASDRDEVARVAGRVVELLVTYDHADPEASLGPLAEIAGEVVLEEYESDVLPELRA